LRLADPALIPGLLLQVKILNLPAYADYALVFLIVAIIAGVLGFGAISGTASF